MYIPFMSIQNPMKSTCSNGRATLKPSPLKAPMLQSKACDAGETLKALMVKS